MTLESPADGETRIDIGVVLAAVWARKLRIILVTLLLLAATYAVLLFVPKMYESSAGILVEPRGSAYTDAATIQQQSATTTGNEVRRPLSRPRTSSAFNRCGASPAAAIRLQMPFRNLATRFGRPPLYIHLSSWCGIEPSGRYRGARLAVKRSWVSRRAVAFASVRASPRSSR